MRARERVAALEADLAKAKAEIETWKEAHATLARAIQPNPFGAWWGVLPPDPQPFVQPIEPWQPYIVTTNTSSDAIVVDMQSGNFSTGKVSS